MNQRLSLSQRGIVHALAIVIGLGLLAVLAFSLNALFASRMQQPPQTAGQPEFGRQLNDEIIEQPSATPTVVTSQTDPTARWKTYVNEQEGYSIKYPDTWTLHEAEGYTFFTSPDLRYEMSLMAEGIQISIDTVEIAEAQLFTTLDQLVEELLDQSSGHGGVRSPGAIVSKHPLSLDDLPAIWITLKPKDTLGSFGIFALDGRNLYRIRCSFQLSRDKEASRILELMGTTFHSLK